MSEDNKLNEAMQDKMTDIKDAEETIQTDMEQIAMHLEYLKKDFENYKKLRDSE